MKKIAICSSISFYSQIPEIKQKLEELGYEVILPYSSIEMIELNNFDYIDYQERHKNETNIKLDRMKRHFEEIEKNADAILVINNEKHGKQGYIGGNVFMEMTIAFHFKKPIFVLHPLDKTSSYIDELKTMQPIIINSQLETIIITSF